LASPDDCDFVAADLAPGGGEIFCRGNHAEAGRSGGTREQRGTEKNECGKTSHERMGTPLERVRAVRTDEK